MERSLFERLQRQRCPVKMLSVQYRMHPEIRQVVRQLIGPWKTLSLLLRFVIGLLVRGLTARWGVSVLVSLYCHLSSSFTMHVNDCYFNCWFSSPPHLVVHLPLCATDVGTMLDSSV